jgi:stromal membrane-associated protein
MTAVVEVDKDLTLTIGTVPPFSSKLRVKGKSCLKGMKPWHTRWFVLNDTGVVWYASEEAARDTSRQQGRVPMHLLNAAAPNPEKGPTRFVMHCKLPRGGGLETMHVDADSAAVMNRWVDLVTRHLNERSDGLCYAQSKDANSGRASAREAASASDGEGRPAAVSSGGSGETSTRVRARSVAHKTALHTGQHRNVIAAGGGSAETRQRQVTAAMPGDFIGVEVERRIQKIAGNDVCADCRTSDPSRFPVTPTWASTNLGTVFCIRCSGVHRKIGAHITKVLSIQIDSWSEEQLSHMESLGNERVNAELEACVPEGVSKPDKATCTDAELEAFIRAKYELGSFKEGGDGRLPEVAAGSTAAGAAKAAEEFVGLLIIRLLKARDLPNMDIIGATDAFVEFTLGERKAKSKTISNSVNPVWNQMLSLNVKNLRETLIIKCFDEDRFKAPSFIGQALVPLQDLPHDGEPMGMDLTLTSGSKRSRGSVAVEITYNPLDR